MFNIFGNNKSEQQPAQQQQNQQQQGQQQPNGQQQQVQQQPSGDANINTATPTPDNTAVQTPGTAPNGVVPNNVQTPETPLDNFKDLWEAKPNENNSGNYTPEQLDPAKLQEVVSKVNLASVVTPEMQQKIAAGGEEATQAFSEAMNLVAQNTLMQSTTVANKMIESQVAKSMEAVLAKVPQLVKDQSVNSALNEANPLYSNPAVAPVIAAVKSQLQTKYPNATPKELTGMAQDFVEAMSTAFTPKDTTQSTDSNNEIDWDVWAQQQ